MPKKIAILTSGHHTNDERLFNKISKTLADNGFEVAIYSTLSDSKEKSNSIIQFGRSLNTKSNNFKKKHFLHLLNEFNPDIIICAEVMPLIPALKYRKAHPGCRVVYDVTEWFPENLKFSSKLSDRLKFPFAKIFSRAFIRRVDGVIFGEQRKINKFENLIGRNPRLHLPYYPILKNFEYIQPDKTKGKLTAAFTGILTAERGLFRLTKAAEMIWREHPEIDFRLLVVGKFLTANEENLFNNIKAKYTEKISVRDWVNYENISGSIAEADICIDLRELNFINNNSLPIKIFEYMACGKPVIYSEISAIREDLPIDDFGVLVEPKNTGRIVEEILNFAGDKEMLYKKSSCARKMVERKYNWEALEMDLIKFINSPN